MDVQTHWDKVYKQKGPDAVSWYRPHLEKSFALIQQFAPQHTSCIIDVGGGESTLVDDLLQVAMRTSPFSTFRRLLLIPTGNA